MNADRFVSLSSIAMSVVACGGEAGEVPTADPSVLYDACNHREVGTINAERGIYMLDDGTVFRREDAIEVAPGSPEVTPSCEAFPGVTPQMTMVQTGTKTCIYDHSAIEGGGWVYETVCYDSATEICYVSIYIVN